MALLVIDSVSTEITITSLSVWGAFFPYQFHQLFTLSSWGSLETKWGHSDDALALISVPEDCIVLASGLFKFFKSVQRLIITHGGTFVFSHNVPFHHHPRWDLSCKYRY